MTHDFRLTFALSFTLVLAADVRAEVSPDRAQLRQLSRQLRIDIQRKNLKRLKEYVEPNGTLRIYIKQCIGECDTPTEKDQSWTRATLTLRSFASIRPDEDLKPECTSDVLCFQSEGKYVCRAGCGGYQGEFYWTANGNKLYLSEVNYTYD